MGRILDLPAGLLLLLFTAQVSGTGWHRPVGNTSSLGPSGTGSAYATACASAFWSFSSASSSWTSAHLTVSNQTQVLGGPTVTEVTYYANATTLCDGHPRVPHSPAVPVSSATVTTVISAPTTEVDPMTGFPEFPGSSPTCSILPSDCDPLWTAYSSSLRAWHASPVSRTSGATAAQITAPPQTPPCMNQSGASSVAEADSAIFGCGMCTLFGEGVQLVYFPVPSTVSRDSCASTPTASLTHYDSGAVIEAYAGTEYSGKASHDGSEVTAVIGKNTFTSGTAYISIATVWAEDRCSSRLGTPVHNAILAMPSQSVLSLRYSQDHFQYFMATDRQTGYPVSYADFNTPIPWSAWNGQNLCYGPYGGWACNIIYEDNYRPQLAIPPEIYKLDPKWKDCQLWYGGLYDPPHALQPQQSIALPTVPGHHEAFATSAAPSPAVPTPTAAPTALPDENGERPSHSHPGESHNAGPGGHNQHDPQTPSDPHTPGDSHTPTDPETPSGPQTSTGPESPSDSQTPTDPQTDPQASDPQASWDTQTPSNHQTSGGRQTPGHQPGNQGGHAWTGGGPRTFVANGQTHTASECGENECIDGATVSANAPATSFAAGAAAIYDVSGVLRCAGTATVAIPPPAATDSSPGPNSHGSPQASQTTLAVGSRTIVAEQCGVSGAIIVTLLQPADLDSAPGPNSHGNLQPDQTTLTVDGQTIVSQQGGADGETIVTLLAPAATNSDPGPNSHGSPQAGQTTLTVDGQTIVSQQGGVSGDVIVTLPAPTATNSAPGPNGHGSPQAGQKTLTVDGQAVTVQQGGVEVDTITLTAGGPATTLSDDVVLSAANGELVLGWSSNIDLADAVVATSVGGPHETQGGGVASYIANALGSSARVSAGSTPTSEASLSAADAGATSAVTSAPRTGQVGAGKGQGATATNDEQTLSTATQSTSIASGVGYPRNGNTARFVLLLGIVIGAMVIFI